MSISKRRKAILKFDFSDVVVVVSVDGLAISQFALLSLRTLALIFIPSNNIVLILMSLPLITLIMSTSAEKFFKSSRVSPSNFSIPTTVTSFKFTFKFGNELNIETPKSPKFTLALTELFISFLVKSSNLPLKRNGKQATTIIIISNVIPKILTIFFICVTVLY